MTRVTMTAERQAYSVADFCNAFGIARSTFYRLLHEGRGPSLIHIGKRTLISVDAVDQWRRRMETEQAAG
jgi:excisionase family DNA binding protein